MMRHACKRLLALVLALVFCVSLFPAAALAEGAEDGEEARAVEGAGPYGETEVPEALAFTLQPEDGEIPAEGCCTVFWELSFVPDRQELLLEETDEEGEPLLTPAEELPAEARSLEIEAEGTYRLRAWLGEDSALSEAFTVTFAPGEGAPAVSEEEPSTPPDGLAEDEGEGDATEALSTEDETDAQTPAADLNANSGSCGTNLTWTLDSGTLTISGTGEMKDWTPNESGWNPSPWFYDAYDITAVVIRSGVTSIGDGAFLGCENLTSVAIPDSVTRIGDSAFSSCSSLSELTLPGNLQRIGDSAFSSCVNLTGLAIPGSVTHIGGWAFNSCTSLTELYYGGPVADWQALDCIDAYNRFRVTVHCTDGDILPGDASACGDNLTWTLDESGTLTISGTGDMWDFIGYEAPWGSRIQSVVIEDGVTGIGGYAFFGCFDMTGISIPESVTHIGSCAFSGCRNLTQVTLPSGLTCIEDGAFSSCGLNRVTIPEGVTSIGNLAFAYGNLAVVDFPSTLTSIGECAFYDCDIWSLRIPEGVTEIGDNAFTANYNLNTVIFPTSLTTIGSGAFTNCHALTRIEIPEGVTGIGSSAFYRCLGLRSVTIPASVTSIGAWAFTNCESLTEIRFGGTMAAWEAMHGSGAIDPYSVTVHCCGGDIAPAGLSACGDHVTWTLTEGGTLILSGSGDMWDYSWDGRAPWHEQKDSIRSLVIQPGVTSVGRYTFGDCTALTSVTIPAGVTASAYTPSATAAVWRASRSRRA